MSRTEGSPSRSQPARQVFSAEATASSPPCPTPAAPGLKRTPALFRAIACAISARPNPAAAVYAHRDGCAFSSPPRILPGRLAVGRWLPCLCSSAERLEIKLLTSPCAAVSRNATRSMRCTSCKSCSPHRQIPQNGGTCLCLLSHDVESEFVLSFLARGCTDGQCFAVRGANNCIFQSLPPHSERLCTTRGLFFQFFTMPLTHPHCSVMRPSTLAAAIAIVRR